MNIAIFDTLRGLARYLHDHEDDTKQRQATQNLFRQLSDYAVAYAYTPVPDHEGHWLNLYSPGCGAFDLTWCIHEDGQSVASGRKVTMAEARAHVDKYEPRFKHYWLIDRWGQPAVVHPVHVLAAHDGEYVVEIDDREYLVTVDYTSMWGERFIREGGGDLHDSAFSMKAHEDDKQVLVGGQYDEADLFEVKHISTRMVMRYYLSNEALLLAHQLEGHVGYGVEVTKQDGTVKRGKLLAVDHQIVCVGRTNTESIPWTDVNFIKSQHRVNDPLVELLTPPVLYYAGVRNIPVTT